jgi:hypothetical protein
LRVVVVVVLAVAVVGPVWNILGSMLADILLKFRD